MRFIMRLCAVCYTEVDKLMLCDLTAHEFECYKRAGPEHIPAEHKERFETLLKWEKRSAAAKRGAATRKAQREAANHKVL
jgi:hypothetical protein